MRRISMKLDILPRVKRLNEMFPEEGFFLDSAYSGWSLRSKKSGREVSSGYLNSRDLYEYLNAFLQGIHFQRQESEK